jgi:hypothetical protein
LVQPHHPINYQKQIEGQKVKSVKLFIIAAAVCLSVGFFSGSAQAQIQSIVVNYCVEVADSAVQAAEELAEGNLELLACVEEYGQCLDGLFGDFSRCFKDYGQCINRADSNQLRACRVLLREVAGDTRRAERKADRDDVEDEFLDWWDGNSSVEPTREECLDTVQIIALACGRIIE